MDKVNGLIIASPEFIQKINSMDEKINIILTALQNKDESDNFLTGEEARKMLNVSKATWQNMRDNRRIPFAQIGRKIYVKKGDIDEYLTNHLINNK
jgi:excisionase family DNA binding protein